MAGRSVYSILLDDDMIAAVDRIAQRNGISRSAMIERLISERISYISPQNRISEIFEDIGRLMSGVDGFTSWLSSDRTAYQLKSGMARFRPSVRYEVKIYDRMSGADFGELDVYIRSDDPAVLSSGEDFFRAFCRLERMYLTAAIPGGISCGLDMRTGRFRRGLRLDFSADHGADEIARSITDYISMLDTMMKRWYGREYLSPEDMENDYLSYLNGGVGII